MRNLYLTNIPVEQALESFQSALKPYLKPESETIEVIHSLDRVTAGEVFAQSNSPLYDSAAMDGVAVISDRTHGASEAAPLTLKQGEDFLTVDTGNPVRPPFDAVIMAEDIQETQTGGIIIRSAAAPGQHIRPTGEDIAQGEMILPGGHKIRPVDVGALLSGGVTQIPVRKAPRTAIIPTGSELIEPGDEIREGCIIESNTRMFEAIVKRDGGVPTRFDIVRDDYELIKKTVRDAADNFDIILISAGTSAGRQDYTINILRELGEVVTHGVAMKPGKPVILAMVNGKPVIGLPGYPVSAYLVYETFVAPVLASFTGLTKAGAAVVKATLSRRLVSSLKYREYVRVKIERLDGRFVATPLARGAGAVMSLVRADGFCIIEQDIEGVEAGSEVDVLIQ